MEQERDKGQNKWGIGAPSHPTVTLMNPPTRYNGAKQNRPNQDSRHAGPLSTSWNRSPNGHPCKLEPSTCPRGDKVERGFSWMRNTWLVRIHIQ